MVSHTRTHSPSRSLSLCLSHAHSLSLQEGRWCGSAPQCTSPVLVLLLCCGQWRWQCCLSPAVHLQRIMAWAHMASSAPSWATVWALPCLGLPPVEWGVSVSPARYQDTHSLQDHWALWESTLNPRTGPAGPWPLLFQHLCLLFPSVHT
jgi:hypothetical protein